MVRAREPWCEGPQDRESSVQPRFEQRSGPIDEQEAARPARGEAREVAQLEVGAELAPEVRVNAVCPGYVDTPWQSNALGTAGANKAAEHYSNMVPLKDFEGLMRGLMAIDRIVKAGAGTA